VTAAPLHLAGERFMLCPSGALLWPAQRLMAVADLHLEKASHHAARGRFLPPYDTRETLARLANALRRHGPAQLVLLGDSFHDDEGAARLGAEDRAQLLRLLEGRAVTWVLGNHDPSPQRLPGDSVSELALGPVTFRHIGGAPLPRHGAAEISGHFHPKATLGTRAGPVTRPCFLTDPRRVVLPAFGALTGGLDVRDPALAAVVPRGGRLFMLGRERLHSLAH
jgi:DNA ligase-associated metallophosphoesterase